MVGRAAARKSPGNCGQHITGPRNNTVNVVSTVHCLFGGCRTGRSLSGAMSQVTQKEARGAAPAAAAAAAAAIVAPLPPATVRPRGGVEPLPLPRTPRRRAQHPGGPRSRQACARIWLCSLLSALKCHTGASGSRRREQREPSHLEECSGRRSSARLDLSSAASRPDPW